MASLNVAEWTPDQVSDWLSGVDGGRALAGRLRAGGVGGARLLALRCDDLHYLGIHVIGHQELLLEAVEHLRNFHYEMRRECVQQLAVRVSAAGAGLSRALRGGGGAGAGGGAGGLETQALADVARLVSAVKPLACWLARWPLACVEALAERRAALLKLALEAATCAQRDRFADQPARAIAAAAAAAAATADYIIQDVSDPGILAPASLECVCVRQGHKPLGFALLPAACPAPRLQHRRFGSPAHASGQVHDGDEIVGVGDQCVVGWGGAAVELLCRDTAARHGDLPLQLRRRGARPPPPARPARLPAPAPAPLALPLPLPAAEPAGRGGGAGAGADADAGAAEGRRPDSSDESDALSPPASPTHLHAHHTRMYPPKPARAAQRRHSVSGGSPVARRPNRSIEQFWRELREQQWERGGGSARLSPQPDADPCALYRHKAVSCSTGLELSPRPRTCLGVALPSPGSAGGAGGGNAPPSPRGKLDKSHSTPAYSLEGEGLEALPPPPPPHTPIPESPTIEVNGPNPHAAFNCTANGPDTPPVEAMNPLFSESSPMAVASAVNVLLSPRAPPPPPPPRPASRPAPPAPTAPHTPPPANGMAACRAPLTPLTPPTPPSANGVSASAPPTPAREFPALKIVPRQPDTTDKKEWSPLKPLHKARLTEISPPLRTLARLEGGGRPRLPALNAEPDPAPSPCTSPAAHAPAAPAPAPLSAPTTPDVHPAAPAGGGGGATRGLFPSAKTRSLKKKNSLLAKRRAVPWRAVCGRGAVSVCGGLAGPAGPAGPGAGSGAGAVAGPAAGAVWQRVRARGATLPRWARRHLLLVHNVLYAYRSPECLRAACMIQLAGWVVCPAGEVRSRQHAFKVYHTGRAVYFAAESREAMAAWIQLLTRATLPALAPHEVDPLKQYSETDYSETESDVESGERDGRDGLEGRAEGRREKEKDKSKFGSLKKLTSRMRSDSSEAVGAGGAGSAGSAGGAASLDRKYLRIFSRKPKIKSGPVPVPTEHYRSYRRVSPSVLAPAPAPAPALAPALAPAAALAPPALTDAEIQAAVKLKATRYAHASNPNLAGGEWRAAGFGGGVVGGGARRAGDALFGFVTLEEFMLKKQEEERKQVYTNRVLMGIERSDGERAQKEIQKQLDKIVPDVIYGELPDAPGGHAGHVGHGGHGGSGGHGGHAHAQRALPPEPAPPPVISTAHGGSKPISVKGKDGYEKIVYPEDLLTPHTVLAAHTFSPDRWRDSLRRNDRVHSGSGEGSPRLSHLALPAPAAPPAQPSAPAASAAPDPIPSADPPAHIAAGSESSGRGGGGGGGAPPGGVSRLRLIFSSRSHSKDAHPTGTAPPLAPQSQRTHTAVQEAFSPSTDFSPSRPTDFPPSRRASGASGAGGEAAGAGAGVALLAGGLSTASYPHLQCPPTFQPETYSLARPLPPPTHPHPPAHPAHPPLTPHARRHHKHLQ